MAESGFKPGKTRVVKVLRGVPGSGKSTYAAMEWPDATVFSADRHFETPQGWVFDPTKLGEAHAECLRAFVEAVTTQAEGVLVVDNTNSSLSELAPYCALALAYGWTLEVITLLTSPEAAYARNVHGVPLGTVLAIDARLRATALPPWWPQRTSEEPLSLVVPDPAP